MSDLAFGFVANLSGANQRMVCLRSSARPNGANTNDCLLDGQHTIDDPTAGVNLVVEILQLLLEILSLPLVKLDLRPVKAIAN